MQSRAEAERSIKDIAGRVQASFLSAGYLVDPPSLVMHGSPESFTEEEQKNCEANVQVYAPTGAGGSQDALIKVTGDGFCFFYASKPYLIPPGLSHRDVEVPMDCGGNVPSNSKDLEQVLLRKVREQLISRLEV